MAISCGAFPEGLGLGDVETVSDLNLRCVRSELGVWRGRLLIGWDIELTKILYGIRRSRRLGLTGHDRRDVSECEAS